jgi:hypothetical protein
VLNSEFLHRKVEGVASGQARPYSNCCRRDQAVGLMEGDSGFGVLLSPRPGSHSLFNSEGGKPESLEQTPRRALLTRTDPSPNLLDRDHADPWLLPLTPQAAKTIGGLASAQNVDKHRRVEEKPRHVSTSASLVTPTLFSNPSCRILVPGMAMVGDRPHAGLDVIPSLLILEPTTNQLTDERATAAFTRTAVEFGHQMILEPDV